MTDFDPAQAAAAVVAAAESAQSAERADLRILSADDTDAVSAVSAESAARRALASRTPEPLGSAATLPPFPADLLPGWAADMVDAVAESVQVPADSPGTVLLGALATACGGRAVVHARGDWVEPLNLFVLVTAGSSERKSPVLRAMRAPILVAEKNLVDLWVPEAREKEVLLQAARQRADAARKGVANADDDAREAAAKEAAELMATAEGITVPVKPRILAGGDATPEAIAALLSRYEGRMAIWDAEGGLFDKLAGMYNSGTANLDVVLQAYSGDPISVERRNRDPEQVENPSLSMVLMVQPTTLRRVTGDAEMVGRGLAARFVYTLPESLVGRRKTGRAVVGVPATVREAYIGNLARLTIGMHGWTDPARLTLAADALDVLDAHEAGTEKRLGPGGDLAATGAWGGKHDGRTVRFAGLLHLATLGPDRGPRAVITGEIMTAACGLAAYYAEHGKAALLPPANEISRAGDVLDHLRRHELDTFTIRGLTTDLPRSRFAGSAAVTEAVDELEARGWVALVPPPTRRGAGRKPSPRYVTHPCIAAD